MNRAAALLLCLCLLCTPPAARADDACTEAHALRLGDAAPCAGVLLPEATAAELLAAADLVPPLRLALSQAEDQLAACAARACCSCEQPLTPWWQSPVFWGVVAGVAGVALGAGLTVGLYVYLH